MGSEYPEPHIFTNLQHQFGQTFHFIASHILSLHFGNANVYMFGVSTALD